MIDLNIRSVENGYIATYEDHDNDGGLCDKEIAFEFDDNIDCDDAISMAMVRLLYFVKDHFGIHYNKHNKKNIQIIYGEEKSNE